MKKAGDGGVVGRMRLGKYEIGRTLGEGNFGMVKYARNFDTGDAYAIKILDRKRIQSLKIEDQIIREIGTLKLLKHPNVVRLHEVSASRTKIYMVLEYVGGGELFDKIEAKGKLSEAEGRKLFQQLIDGVSYCHDKGIYHRDLKPENILVDAKGNIKISDFGLSALPQHVGKDGLLHTTCGSPNYIAPEILLNRGYDGTRSDIWSCGVILFAILTGNLPFEDRNMAVLYQKIFRGDAKIPKCLSSGAQNILTRILDPNPLTRINVSGIREHNWFKQDYVSVAPTDDDVDINLDIKTLLVKEHNNLEEKKQAPRQINAFELIGMASSLDLSGLFEREDISEWKNIFTSNYLREELFQKMKAIVTEMGLQIQKGYDKLKITRQNNSVAGARSISVAAEVFELSSSLYVIELRKAYGDSSIYRQLCSKLSDQLYLDRNQQLSITNSLVSELGNFEEQVAEAPDL